MLPRLCAEKKLATTSNGAMDIDSTEDELPSEALPSNVMKIDYPTFVVPKMAADATAVSPGTPPLPYSAPVDATDLLSGISPPENEMALSRALLFGNRPVNDTVLSIASDELFQDDLIRLDGSFIPNEKKASDIWLNKKYLLASVTS